MNKAYVIDGNSLLFRAYYATAFNGTEKIMRTKEGIPTNAIFAFSNMINKILGGLKDGDLLFVGFDTGTATFRHKEDATYKYPNPTSDFICIKNIEPQHVTIYSLDGKLIKTVENTNVIDVRDLNKGVYLINIDGTIKKFEVWSL